MPFVDILNIILTYPLNVCKAPCDVLFVHNAGAMISYAQKAKLGLRHENVQILSYRNEPVWSLITFK